MYGVFTQTKQSMCVIDGDNTGLNMKDNHPGACQPGQAPGVGSTPPTLEVLCGTSRWLLRLATSLVGVQLPSQ